MAKRNNLSVLVCGAGIAGPTLAHWLLAHGFTPTLVERAPAPRGSGYIIDFWGLGYDIAERMGLLPDIEREGYRVKEVRFVDDAGRRVGGFDARVFGRLAGGRYVSLPRGALAGLLYREVRDRCEIVFGDGVASLEDSGEEVGVSFEHGPARAFDLVIGADGLHSAVRRLAFGPEVRFERYLGYAVAAFETAGYRPRDEDVYVSYAAPGKQAARFAMRDDRTMALFVFAVDAAVADVRDPAAQRAVLRRVFADGGWECAALLSAMDQTSDLYVDHVSQIHAPAWSRGRVGLVGDAAFCPSLLAGQGAALAMIAAYVLAGELAAAEGDFARAFQRYEQRLRPFMALKQRAAEKFATSFAPKTKLGLFLRNQISKALAFPPVADLAFGRELVDRLDLPDYRR
jgi:2-polyprenyl-6-methoxyphenol hydroxylase-like FAD-dependent oxidoreductase